MQEQQVALGLMELISCEVNKLAGNVAPRLSFSLDFMSLFTPRSMKSALFFESFKKKKEMWIIL